MKEIRSISLYDILKYFSLVELDEFQSSNEYKNTTSKEKELLENIKNEILNNPKANLKKLLDKLDIYKSNNDNLLDLITITEQKYLIGSDLIEDIIKRYKIKDGIINTDKYTKKSTQRHLNFIYLVIQDKICNFLYECENEYEPYVNDNFLNALKEMLDFTNFHELINYIDKSYKEFKQISNSSKIGFKNKTEQRGFINFYIMTTLFYCQINIFADYFGCFDFSYLTLFANNKK
ncbi:hypothetical protein [Mycoplasma feriruminatoris]|uniref:hypothetical protein n=1 Tax=Mycoplasma feriruminatoris TaxID=1179777 RepID=UPI0002A50AC4|nr:hypothetical protein [Mycoplasma feriruminatoris]UKS53966.1 hypothetical protein D500_00310 [Mycoplasma feriruminatoris]UKS53987.1 hypothetical protein D500_00331 [Mycoplasma feriruminatoris]VZK65153.1 hypothetical protein MF5292_00318 [Mycoplasma feriruminatoris]VZR75299.1 hypothetical protein MF5294_00319 [Mycoplasma feriruminatoris]VZR97434.1 hypothetical protein MF5293_00318 [Mycoplasma feriruminatoris]